MRTDDRQHDEGEPGAEASTPPARTLTQEELLEHSVFDEPAFSGELAGDAAGRRVGYREALAGKREAMAAGESWVLVMLMAAAAGPWAVAGAIVSTAGVGVPGILAAVIAAPLVEEMMKVALPMWAVECRPWWFRSRGQILACGLAGGLAFAAIENVIYLKVYIDEPSAGIVAWRWTVCVALHTCCSAMAAIGLAKVWSAGMRSGTRPGLSSAAPWLVVAMVTHGAYNAFALGLGIAGYDF